MYTYTGRGVGMYCISCLGPPTMGCVLTYGMDTNKQILTVENIEMLRNATLFFRLHG